MHIDAVLLQTITKVPHLAGDFQDLILADFVKQKFLDFGLDYAEVCILSFQYGNNLYVH